MKFFYVNVSLILFLILLNVSVQAQQLAFPGAEGFGKYATGGRTGTVYRVTNLNDSGTGSFRDAVSQSNRIVVFDVAGVVNLTSGLVIKSNIYIAGQTAPGEGITVYGDRISFTGADNTICRYMRFRMGIIGTSGKDAMGIANGKNMIFDHVSVSWGQDETFSISWDGKGTEPTNITIQNSIISQGLLLHSAGGLIQTNGGVTLYRNLYVDNSTRNNKVKGVNQYVNNVVYNWKNGAYIMGGDSEGSSYVNVVGNYFVKGPDNGGTPISDGNADFHIYADDNWYDNNLDGELNGYEIPRSEYSGGPTFHDTPFDYPILPTIDATSLIDNLLPVVGASLPYRDLADYYVINEVKTLGVEGELISNENTLSIGAPSSWSLWTGYKRTDSDNDGMPDEWEDVNGTNKGVNDAMTIAANGYANVENYINSIDASWSQEYIRKPLNFKVQDASQNSITFEWLDYTEKEDGYVIQRYVNDTWVNVDTTDTDANTYTLTGLEPEESGTFRIFGFNSLIVSDFSATITAKSRPIEVPVVDPLTYKPELTWGALADNSWNKSSVNWLNESSNYAFADDSTVLFGDTLTGDQTIDVSEVVAPAVTFVKSDFDYSFSGTGNISGSGSFNKIGSGTVTISTNNTYTGATVVWDGTLVINKLANGGISSSIGASQNYAFNWVMKGGAVNYTGGSVTTDRNILLDETGELSVVNSLSTVTMNGTMTGAGGFIKSGAGTLKLFNEIGNNYEGTTVIKGGVVDLDMQQKSDVSNVLGTSNVVSLAGGTLKTTNGQTSNYEVYSFDIDVPEGTIGGFAPFRNCYIKSKVIGSGTLNYTIPYLREYIQGDWSLFSGVLKAYGSNASDGSQLLLNNIAGLPYARVNLSGNAKIINWATTGTMRLGGLSGNVGTYLGSASKQTDGTKMYWIVGGASTDETFNGIINNDCSANGHYGITYITKEGTGIWRLNGNNVYKGTTTVNDGKLIFNGTNTGTGAITVNGGTIAGKGRVYGAITVKADAFIEPGDNSISTFTVAGLTLLSGSTCEFDVNRTTLTNDKIASTGAVVYNGTLKLNVTGTFELGDQMTLFSGISHSGSFTDIIPATPGDGLFWSFANGILSVTNVSGIEKNIIQKIDVNPNPVVDIAHLELGDGISDVTIVLHDLSGSVLLNKQFKGSSIELNLSDFNPGIYLIEVIADDQIIAKSKLIKE